IEAAARERPIGGARHLEQREFGVDRRDARPDLRRFLLHQRDGVFADDMGVNVDHFGHLIPIYLHSVIAGLDPAIHRFLWMRGSSARMTSGGYAALMPCRLWEESLQVKNSTSAPGVAFMAWMVSAGM